MKFRFARPTNDLSQVRKFYIEGIGLTILGGFENHEGFDGMMLGQEGWPYHLEFTTKVGHQAPPSPSEDLLLVFYFTNPKEYEIRKEKMKSLGFLPVKSFNPYWDQNGLTYQDFEGYRVVLVNGPSPF